MIYKKNHERIYNAKIEWLITAILIKKSLSNKSDNLSNIFPNMCAQHSIDHIKMWDSICSYKNKSFGSIYKNGLIIGFILYDGQQFKTFIKKDKVMHATNIINIKHQATHNRHRENTRCIRCNIATKKAIIHAHNFDELCCCCLKNILKKLCLENE